MMERLVCAWTARRNRHAVEDVCERVRAAPWRARDVRDASDEGRLCTCADLALSCFPDLDLSSLLVVVGWLEALFDADDLRDTSGGELNEPALDREWLAAFSARCGSAWRTRVEALFREHVRALRWERGWRRRGEPPPLDEYVRNAACAGGIHVSLALGAAMLDLDATAQDWMSPGLALAIRLAADHVRWTNDLMGLARERAERNAVNLPTVLERWVGFSHRDAPHETAQRCNELARILERRAEVLERNNASRVTAHYVGWLREAVAGHLTWSKATERYSGWDPDRSNPG